MSNLSRAAGRRGAPRRTIAVVKDRLSAAFLEAIRPTTAAELECADLEARLRDIVHSPSQRSPGLELDELDFIDHPRGDAARGEGPAAWFEHVRAGDLWLAFACATGNSAGIKAFEQEFAEDIGRVVRRFGSTSEQRDELLQALRDKLFVGSASKAPKLASYAGVGFLQNWLRVTATRMFLDLRRSANAAVPEVALDIALVAHSDFEFGLLKERYRSDFKTAFADATAALEPSERNLLRRRLEGLNVDQIGALEGVHRSTAARRLEKARHRLLQNTRSKLGERLGVDHSELDSVMRQVQTLDVSLERLLESKE